MDFLKNNSYTYNLKAVIHETGINPATLRAWERRYGLLKPQRSPGGHRLYSERDIEILKWLVSRQKEGLSISQAVQMWRNLETNDQDPLQQTSPAQIHAGSGKFILDDLRRDWIAACLAFDEQAAEHILADSFGIATAEDVCIEILQKGLAEIGQGWSMGSVSVQQEHFASALAMRRLNMLVSSAALPNRTGRILAACPPGEQHEFALLLMTFFLRRRGWDVVYLGANVPLSQLDAAIGIISPRLILTLAETLTSAAKLREMADYIRTRGGALAYGGGIFHQYPTIQERISGYYLGDNIALVPKMAERLMSQFPPLPAIQPLDPRYTEALQIFLENESQITTSVATRLRDYPIRSTQLEEVNLAFSQNVTAALSLGNIEYLDYFAGGVSDLFGNEDTTPGISARYFAAFRQAIEQHLGIHFGLIEEWFARHAATL